MQYWLDAYNIIGAMPNRSLSDANKEIQFIAYIQAKGIATHYWIVFDGHDGDVSHERHPNYTVVFTPADQSADDYIVEKTARCAHPDAQVVVTDDRALARAARRNGVHVQSCVEFLAQLSTQSRAAMPEKPQTPWDAEVDWLCDRWGEG